MIKFDITGDKELSRAFKELERYTYTKQVLNRAFKQAMKPITAEAKIQAKKHHNTSGKKKLMKGRRALAGSIRAKVSKNGIGVWLGPNHSTKMGRMGHWFEKGTKERNKRGRIQGSHFMWKAYVKKKTVAQNILRPILLKELARKKAKLGL